MKITLKIQPETLFLIHRLVLDKSQTYVWDIGRKVAKSMQIELFETLARSCIIYQANPNGKPRKVTLRYHLVNQLYETILEVVDHPSLGIYERTKLDQLKNELHQKLL